MSEPINYTNLFLAPLPKSVRNDDLQEIFNGHGATSASVMMDVHSGRSKGFAFIAFASSEDGERAMRELSSQSCTAPTGEKFTLNLSVSSHKKHQSVIESNVVYFRNLPIGAGEAEITELLGRYGEITNFSQKPDAAGKFKLATVEFAKLEGAKAAVNEGHGKVLFPAHTTFPVMCKYADNYATKQARRARRQQNQDQMEQGSSFSSAGGNSSGFSSGNEWGGNDSSEGSSAMGGMGGVGGAPGLNNPLSDGVTGLHAMGGGGGGATSGQQPQQFAQMHPQQLAAASGYGSQQQATSPMATQGGGNPFYYTTNGDGGYQQGQHQGQQYPQQQQAAGYHNQHQQQYAMPHQQQQQYQQHASQPHQQTQQYQQYQQQQQQLYQQQQDNRQQQQYYQQQQHVAQQQFQQAYNSQMQNLAQPQQQQQQQQFQTTNTQQAEYPQQKAQQPLTSNITDITVTTTIIDASPLTPPPAAGGGGSQQPLNLHGVDHVGTESDPLSHSIGSTAGRHSRSESEHSLGSSDSGKYRRNPYSRGGAPVVVQVDANAAQSK